LPESAIAAIGIPQFATGPQKCVLKKKDDFNFLILKLGIVDIQKSNFC
jgi:hypothetical protein